MTRYHERMREARELELREIRASKTWRFLNWLRVKKHRHVDKWLVRAKRRAQTAGRCEADVICLPIIDWDFRFQRPQQLMLQFAKHGYRVGWVGRVNHEAIREASIEDVKRDTLVIVQHPSWWPLVKTCGGRLIYDCMDHHAGFATEIAGSDERELMASAELVIVSSSALERVAKKYAKDVLLLRNGCDYEHFAKTQKADGPRKVIGYYGAISDWFDVPLVAALAKKHPEWDFLLIGSTYGADVLSLTRLHNVALPGERPYEELPEWLGVMDVTIIPFVRNALTEATNPVKVYEMLAAGKPVVSVPIPEVAALAPLVRFGTNVETFERAIVEALQEGDEPGEARRAFAREQTWEKRFAVLNDKLRLR